MGKMRQEQQAGWKRGYAAQTFGLMLIMCCISEWGAGSLMACGGRLVIAN
jgi:hypothetical protein